MHCLPLVLAVLVTNLSDLAKMQIEGRCLPPYRVAATVSHVIPTMEEEGGSLILELGVYDGPVAYCIKILASKAPQPLAAGDRLLFDQPEMTPAWPVYYGVSAKFLSHEDSSPPVPVETGGVLHGGHDYGFVRVRGVLRSVQTSELNAQWVCVVLKCGGQNLYATTPSWPGAVERLMECLHSEITIDGIVLPRDGSKRLRIGRILRFAGPESVRRLKQASSAPELTPELEKVDNLPPSEIANLPRHRVHGTVIATWDAKKALLKTDSGMICRIACLSGKVPSFNDRIEAIGYPECDLLSLNLSDAEWHLLDAPPVSRQAGATDPNERIESGPPEQAAHGSLIRLTGTVVAVPEPNVNDRLLHLNCAGQVVPVNAGSADRPFDALCQGMVVEVTGVCIKEIENYSPSHVFPRVTGTLVVLRTPSDLRVVSRPSWWTPARIWSAFGLLLAAFVGILTWNAALRKMATRKSRELFKEQLGHVKADLRTEERTRLAVELHDTLAQNLTGVSMEIEAAHDLRGDAPRQMLDHLGIAAKALKSCRDELRNCLWDLRSQALDEKDMATAILRTLQPHVSDSNLSVRFNVPRSRISDKTAHSLLRVIRELVVNAIRHGNASSVRVAGTIDGNRLLCSVRDNGGGFDPANSPGILQGHFGLQGIRERIDEIGGEFKIESAPGAGTKATVVVRVPQDS